MENELISRQAALEAARLGLHGFVGMPKTTENMNIMSKVVNGVHDKLEAVPVVDAVEVVRCKDCDFYDSEDGSCTIKSDVDGRPLAVFSTGYCSDGERRTEV